MCNKAFDNYPYALYILPDCYMIKEMCDKVLNTHSSTIESVPECYKTQTMCDKAFNKCFLAFVIFLINRKHKKCVTYLFLMIFFC